MKLVRYGVRGAEKPGMIDADGKLRSLSAHVADITTDILAPTKLAMLKALAVESLPVIENPVRFGVPVSGIGKLIGVARNYADHAAETGDGVPTEPMIFSKWLSSLNGPSDPILIPRGSEKTDWEAELAVVIGLGGKYIAEADAMAHVAGYCTANDVTERAFQRERGGTMDKGKGCDTFAPLGPWLVTADEIPDPHDLEIWLEVDGERRQNGNTRDMIFKIPYLISYLSEMMTLHPGDIILTGTPPGVGLGMKPPVFLRPGQIIRLEVQGLGVQQQQVVADR